MELSITRVGRGQRAVVDNLFQLYIYDLSEMVPVDVDDRDGRFDAPQLDTMWSDSSHPFLLWVDQKVAGFAQVCRGSRLSGDDSIWDMAQFFVLRRYRRGGVGSEMARRLFAMHPGAWEVRQVAANLPATAFWRAAIAELTGGAWRETVVDDERWRGPVQSFVSSPG